MRKISVKMALVLLAITVLAVGCNFVFSSIVSVTVQGPDSSDSSFDSTVYVFGFTDKGARDAAYKAIVEEGQKSSSGEFDDYLRYYNPSGVVDKRIAAYASGDGEDGIIPGLGSASGTIANLTIRWNTMSPAYGEDYDSTYVYIIAAVEENGVCYAGTNDWPVNSGNADAIVKIYDVSNIDPDSII